MIHGDAVVVPWKDWCRELHWDVFLRTEQLPQWVVAERI
jgi:hypothetical protein